MSKTEYVCSSPTTVTPILAKLPHENSSAINSKQSCAAKESHSVKNSKSSCPKAEIDTNETTRKISKKSHAKSSNIESVGTPSAKRKISKKLNLEMTIDITKKSSSKESSDAESVKKENSSPDLFDDVVSPAALDVSTYEEKKKQRSIEYRKYLQRAGPRNPGSKIVPDVRHFCHDN